MHELEIFFHTRLEWAEGEGRTTLDYESYPRSHRVLCPEKPLIEMSAAPQYQGDPNRLNPEELFTASIASCQMLTYLALASFAGIRVLSYTDEAEGVLAKKERKMQMVRVLLRPRIVVVEGTDKEKALALVQKAHTQCFIANSITTEAIIQPNIVVG
ncbi:MAG: OsmC family protein [Nitrospira sp.]|nr:OsmC family peroxiredoxin [Candidatus Manganitrophaceae bacterium]HIL33872.1 OsmC family peroxiredoxin [Candidatus Manganitrophaceae bacterium]